MSAIEALERDVARYDLRLEAAEWRRLRAQITETSVPRKGVILPQARVAERWAFLADGLAASVQTLPDGSAAIARFFEPGQFCANLPSAWRKEPGADELTAVADATLALLPDRIFREQYLRGGGFGEYLRHKAIETLLFDKDLICAKTSTDMEERYRFLETRQARVLERAPQVDIARFLGVTPQGLSRFLRRRGQRRLNPGS